jgi:hypothetical protein
MDVYWTTDPYYIPPKLQRQVTEYIPPNSPSSPPQPHLLNTVRRYNRFGNPRTPHPTSIQQLVDYIKNNETPTTAFSLDEMKTSIQHIEQDQLQQEIIQRETMKRTIREDLSQGIRKSQLLKRFPQATQIIDIAHPEYFPHKQFNTDCLYIWGPQPSEKSLVTLDTLRAISTVYPECDTYIKTNGFRSRWYRYDNEPIVLIPGPLAFQTETVIGWTDAQHFAKLLSEPSPTIEERSNVDMRFTSPIIIVTADTNPLRISEDTGIFKHKIQSRMTGRLSCLCGGLCVDSIETAALEIPQCIIDAVYLKLSQNGYKFCGDNMAVATHKIIQTMKSQPTLKYSPEHRGLIY